MKTRILVPFYIEVDENYSVCCGRKCPHIDTPYDNDTKQCYLFPDKHGMPQELKLDNEGKPIRLSECLACQEVSL